MSFYNIINNKYLIDYIFKKVRGERLVDSTVVSSRPFITFKYDDINSVEWMIDNGYIALLKYKIQRRDVSINAINSDDIASLCSKVTDNDKDIESFDYIYFKCSHLFLCPSVVDGAASNTTTSYPLSKILERSQLDGGYAQWSVATVQAAFNAGSLPCATLLFNRWVTFAKATDGVDPLYQNYQATVPDNTYFLRLVYNALNQTWWTPQKRIDLSNIVIQAIKSFAACKRSSEMLKNINVPSLPLDTKDILRSAHFNLPVDLFTILFNTNNISPSSSSSSSSDHQRYFMDQYLEWLNELPCYEADKPLPSIGDSTIPDLLKLVKRHWKTYNLQQKCTFIDQNTIEMIDFIESKISLQQENNNYNIKEFLLPNSSSSSSSSSLSSYKWIYLKWILKSNRINQLSFDKGKWVNSFIKAAIKEEDRLEELNDLLQVTIPIFKYNIDWSQMYYQDFGHSKCNDIIRRAIQNALPNTTVFLLTHDQVSEDTTELSSFHQPSPLVAIKGGHLPFIQKMYQAATTDLLDGTTFGTLDLQLELLTISAQYDQYEIIKWLIGQIKQDGFDQSVKLPIIQVALETALLHSHGRIVNLILSEFPDPCIFTRSLLEVASVSGNVDFYTSLQRRVQLPDGVPKDFIDYQQSILFSINQGSTKLAHYIIKIVLGKNESDSLLSFSFLFCIHAAIKLGNFELFKYFMESIKTNMDKDTVITQFILSAMDYGRVQVLDYLLTKHPSNYQLLVSDIYRALSRGHISILQYLVSDKNSSHFKVLTQYVKKFGPLHDHPPNTKSFLINNTSLFK
ncbi:hypothetical protein DFA_03020 [Cavenderia fasciculata]|uniref:Ankyrin repeat-containing protein n=1 Tax=Cavenderia fasciculata TaxID=261658 RepID=F4PGE2_CACFS|nr:uncharacterized protein DFA_03020 [Cavenderia fasciculata]EGG24776.1 hypothetical protein DFA_03020 [Cavenderia fasciculata]|eukprot:XP_004362627.1 hypothetical protein DFA_03020 [Cavenderia fasciculata]